MAERVQFFGGPRDGEVWDKVCPPPGRYWFDRTVPREGFPPIERCDLYELRSHPVKGWYYVSTKEGLHKP